jgi:hypothetical protein
MCFARRFFLPLWQVVLFAATGHAIVVAWDGLTRTPGTLNNSYDIDPNPAQAGNDITVTVSGNLLAVALILRHSAKFRK